MNSAHKWCAELNFGFTANKFINFYFNKLFHLIYCPSDGHVWCCCCCCYLPVQAIDQPTNWNILMKLSASRWQQRRISHHRHRIKPAKNTFKLKFTVQGVEIKIKFHLIEFILKMWVCADINNSSVCNQEHFLGKFCNYIYYLALHS